MFHPEHLTVRKNGLLMFLQHCSFKICAAIFDTFRSILNDTKFCKRITYMIEVLFQVRRDKFRVGTYCTFIYEIFYVFNTKDYPSLIETLDLVKDEDQITHTMSLDDAIDPENELSINVSFSNKFSQV